MCQIQVVPKGSQLEYFMQKVDSQVRDEERRVIRESLCNEISDVFPQKEHADRALFVYLGYLAAGGKQDITPFMTASELLDESILILDDAIDKSTGRLGHQPIHKQLGREKAMLMSNGLQQRATNIWTNAAIKAGKIETISPFIEMSEKINHGQYLDMLYAGRPPQEITLNQYKDLVRMTTGVHIGDSLKLGAMLAGDSNGIAGSLQHAGANVGIVGQIYDDTIDWFPEIMRTKESFSDYTGRKARIPYLNAVKNPKTRTEVQRAFRDEEDPFVVRRTLFSGENYKTLREVFEREAGETSMAIQNLQVKNPIQQALQELIGVYSTESARVKEYI